MTEEKPIIAKGPYMNLPGGGTISFKKLPDTRMGNPNRDKRFNGVRRVMNSTYSAKA